MISQKHRFRGHKSLDYTYRNGKTSKSGSLSIKAVPTRGDDYRLAVVVSKKVSKSAVKRNRIRRRIFEQFRKIHKEYDKPIKYDIIITAFSEDLTKTPDSEIAKMCQKLLASVGIRP